MNSTFALNLYVAYASIAFSDFYKLNNSLGEVEMV